MVYSAKVILLSSAVQARISLQPVKSRVHIPSRVYMPGGENLDGSSAPLKHKVPSILADISSPA